MQEQNIDQQFNEQILRLENLFHYPTPSGELFTTHADNFVGSLKSLKQLNEQIALTRSQNFFFWFKTNNALTHELVNALQKIQDFDFQNSQSSSSQGLKELIGVCEKYTKKMNNHYTIPKLLGILASSVIGLVIGAVAGGLVGFLVTFYALANSQAPVPDLAFYYSLVGAAIGALIGAGSGAWGGFMLSSQQLGNFSDLINVLFYSKECQEIETRADAIHNSVTLFKKKTACDQKETEMNFQPMAPAALYPPQPGYQYPYLI